MKQVTQFHKMHSIFDIGNMRTLGELNSVGDLILLAHKLTSSCKGRLINHEFSVPRKFFLADLKY